GFRVRLDGRERGEHSAYPVHFFDFRAHVLGDALLEFRLEFLRAGLQRIHQGCELVFDAPQGLQRVHLLASSSGSRISSSTSAALSAAASIWCSFWSRS